MCATVQVACDSDSYTSGIVPLAWLAVAIYPVDGRATSSSRMHPLPTCMHIMHILSRARACACTQVGLLVLNASLLFAARRKRKLETPLSKATAFLHQECVPPLSPPSCPPP